ncbi:unnamed protein product [Rhodiola kirilowii]
MLKDVKYPSGYAGGLHNKVNLNEKKFSGLKTHDCHVMFERLIPIVIRPYLPSSIVNPILCLCRWFQKLCCRELTRSDVIQLKEDIVFILCHFERIFPKGFFTIMVHLMIHLPDQILLKGPVHYSWMYPIERQLGEYKKYVRNTRYPEGCIAEQYIAQECVTFVKLYLEGNTLDEPTIIESAISVVAPHIRPFGDIPKKKLNKKELQVAHWCVLENCEQAKYFIAEHKEQFEMKYPNHGDKARIKHFISYFNPTIYFLRMKTLQGSDGFNEELYLLSCTPFAHRFYSQCEVNGIKFVTWERDQNRKTQNSGVMVESDDEVYYGVLEDVIELMYPQGVTVIVFKCRWFNENRGDIKRDHGIESVDTSTTWYGDTPFCLGLMAKQVIYVDDPKYGDNWRVANIVAQRGTYTADALARDILGSIEDPYQEELPSNIPQVPIHTLQVDLGCLPQTPREFYNDEDDDEFRDEDSENEDESQNIDIDQEVDVYANGNDDDDDAYT